jgi:transaldolase/glucose-6-phosphate isomerase
MSGTVSVNERMAAITAAGTSVWLDQIRRSLTEGGELQRLVDEDSLRGVTSNPAIFEKAILGSADYDGQIEEMARAGGDARGLYRAIVMQDVKDACDVLRPVYDQTDGVDGYVSLEVDPDLAFDAELTMVQAREFWEGVDRPNLMIKIPGTTECLPAIEEMIYEGRNINVTLLFGVEAYTRVAEAFIKGLERRHDEGKPLNIHSVASFFVSRVDTEVDKRLEALGNKELLGKAGLANARAAYKRFTELFRGERFAKLAEAGAPVQRPLWASTGVKNPQYPETLYVDGLVGPDTVNTMPMPTLLAAAECSDTAGGTTVDIDPQADLEALAAAGIDLNEVTDLLLEQGIDAFVTPMEKLLAGIESKREAIVTDRPPSIEASLPDDLEPAIAARIKQAADENISARMWRKDDTVWGEAGQDEVSDRLGWLTILEPMHDAAPDLAEFAKEAADEGLTDCVLLGMGGSSLAPEVFRQSFGPQEGFLELHVLDSTDAGAIADVHEQINPEKTLFLVSTKSGGTVETLSLFELFWKQVPDGKHFVAITDPGSSLIALAEQHGFRRIFINDPNIGGRYSALSYFGLVPAALMGADVAAILDRAQVAEQASNAHGTNAGNSGLWLGCTLGELGNQGRDKLTFLVSDPIKSFGLWAEQLVAESLGKQGKGILPVADEPLGAADAYGEDRVFVYLRPAEGDPDEELESLTQALIKAGHPVITLSVRGPEDLGRIFFFAEFAVAVAGWAIGVNPFDQPNVQEAKDATKKVLEADSSPDLPDATPEELRALLGDAAPPAFVAIMGYVAPSAGFDNAVHDLRAAIRDATKATTTFGYGPRFLHSTGQLHKGGPDTGRFLQLFHEARPDLEIPKADFTFEELKRAQADGDLQTLRAHGLPAQRLTLRGDDPAGALRTFIKTIQGEL